MDSQHFLEGRFANEPDFSMLFFVLAAMAAGTIIINSARLLYIARKSDKDAIEMLDELDDLWRRNEQYKTSLYYLDEQIKDIEETIRKIGEASKHAELSGTLDDATRQKLRHEIAFYMQNKDRLRIEHYKLLMSTQEDNERISRIRSRIEAAQETFKRLRRRQSIILAVLGTVSGLITLIVQFARTYSGSADSIMDLHIFSTAYAQASSGPSFRPEVTVIPMVVTGIFIVMFLAFLTSVFIVLFVDEKEHNKQRISAANDIVKTLGGFFIGIATSYVNQAVGVS